MRFVIDVYTTQHCYIEYVFLLLCEQSVSLHYTLRLQNFVFSLFQNR